MDGDGAGMAARIAGRPPILTAASRRDGRVGGTSCAPQIGEEFARRSRCRVPAASVGRRLVADALHAVSHHILEQQDALRRNTGASCDGLFLVFQHVDYLWLVSPAANFTAQPTPTERASPATPTPQPVRPPAPPASRPHSYSPPASQTLPAATRSAPAPRAASHYTAPRRTRPRRPYTAQSIPHAPLCYSPYRKTHLRHRTTP